MDGFVLACFVSSSNVCVIATPMFVKMHQDNSVMIRFEE